MRGRWSALGFAALVVLGVGLSQTSQGHALLKDTGLYQVPTSYTELSFTTPNSLPASLKSERAPIDVSFCDPQRLGIFAYVPLVDCADAFRPKPPGDLRCRRRARPGICHGRQDCDWGVRRRATAGSGAPG